MFIKRNSEGSIIRKTIRVGKVPTKLAVDLQIKKIAKDPIAFEELQRVVMNIMKLKREKCMKSSGNIDFIYKNRDVVSSANSNIQRQFIESQRRKNVEIRRDKLENQELKKKFLLAYKWEINQQHV